VLARCAAHDGVEHPLGVRRGGVRDDQEPFHGVRLHARLSCCKCVQYPS
jgi:hypothetical protein